MMVRKTIIILAGLMVSATTLAAQNTWMKTYGGSADDWGWSVQQTSDGGYVVTGWTKSFGSGATDVWILKTDENGDTLWSQTYGDTKYDAGVSIKETSDGGYVLVGSKDDSFNGDEGNLWIIKIDSRGEVLWERDYGEEHGDVGRCVRELADGYIIAGTKDRYNPGCQEGNIWLLRTDTEGYIEWEKTYGEEYFQNAYFVEQTSDGGFIVAGEWTNALCLLKTDANGDSIWMTACKPFDHSNIGYCVRETEDSCFLAAGMALKDLSGDSEVFVLKVSGEGDTLWSRSYGGAKTDMGYYLSNTQDGGFIITGVKDFTTSYTGGDLYVLKLDSEGDTLWARTIGGAGTDWGHSIEQTQDNGYIITGYTKSSGSGGSDLWLIKTDSLGYVGVEEPVTYLSPQTWEITSPVGAEVVLKYQDHPDGFSASVFDASGRKVDEINSTRTSGVITWPATHQFGPGVYFIKANQDSRTQKVIIIR